MQLVDRPSNSFDNCSSSLKHVQLYSYNRLFDSAILFSNKFKNVFMYIYIYNRTNKLLHFPVYTFTRCAFSVYHLSSAYSFTHSYNLSLSLFKLNIIKHGVILFCTIICASFACSLINAHKAYQIHIHRSLSIHPQSKQEKTTLQRIRTCTANLVVFTWLQISWHIPTDIFFIIFENAMFCFDITEFG